MWRSFSGFMSRLFRDDVACVLSHDVVWIHRTPIVETSARFQVNQVRTYIIIVIIIVVVSIIIIRGVQRHPRRRKIHDPAVKVLRGLLFYYDLLNTKILFSALPYNRAVLRWGRGAGAPRFTCCPPDSKTSRKNFEAILENG